MNDSAKLGVITGIFLLIFLLIGAVCASVLVTSSKEISEEEDLNKIVNEVVDELCSYLQIKHIVGKYHMIQGEQKINKIAILITPLVSQTIDMSHMTLKLCDGEHYHLLFYNGEAGSIHSHSLFEHPLWDSLDSGSFSLLSTIDDDNSIIHSHLINKNTDMVFIILQLSDDTALKNGDQFEITILPSPGTGRTVHLEAPLPIKNVVTLYP
jgi:archaellin